MDTRQKARLPLVVIGACVALTVISFFDEPLSLLGVGLAIVLLGLVVATPKEEDPPHSRVAGLLITTIIIMLAAVLASAKLDASIRSAPRPAQSSQS